MSQQQPGVWDVVAPTYAEDIPQWITYSEEALKLVSLRPTDRLIDIASGPGTLACLAAPMVARVDAVDFSSGMIEELRKRAPKNVDAKVMDAQSLDFPDASFDAAFCMFAYFFFPDRAKAFSEMLRVLKPGGRAVIATWTPIDRRPAMKLGFESLAEAMPQMPRPSKGDLQEPEECVREMSAAGFADVSTSSVTTTLHVTSAEHYFETLERSAAPVAALKRKLSPEAWAATREAVLVAMRKRLPNGSADLTAEAILTIGTRAP